MKEIGLTLDEVLSSADKEIYERYEHSSKKGFLEIASRPCTTNYPTDICGELKIRSYI